MGKSSNQRANVKNPNNIAFKAAADNRSVQMNTPANTVKADSQKLTVASKKK